MKLKVEEDIICFNWDKERCFGYFKAVDWTKDFSTPF